MIGVRRIVSKSVFSRSSVRLLGGGHGHGHELKQPPPLPDTPILKGEDQSVMAYHVGRSIDLVATAAQLELKGNQTPTNVLSVLVDKEKGVGFDIFSYGSVVFYNSNVGLRGNVVKDILRTAPLPAETPYLVPGYGFTNPLFNVSFANDSELPEAAKSNLTLLRAAGVSAARAVALDYYDVSLDRIIESIHTLSEEELQGHINNVIRGVNNVDALSVPTLTNSPDTTEDAKRGLLNAFHAAQEVVKVPESYSEIHFKLNVVLSQYNVKTTVLLPA